MLAAVLPGVVVWLVLASALVTFTLLTTLAAARRRSTVPHAGDLARWVVAAWPGRVVALTGWAVAGWHVFCQRP